MAKVEGLDLKNIKNIHLIGIGGSGIFPIAKWLVDKGFSVTGSDTCNSETTEKAKNAGIKVCIGHKAENLGSADLVVFSAAIKASNPEIEEAHTRGIPCIERSVMLGIIMSKYKNSIAVSGTHGKTTTTSMITNILLDAQKDPTAIIGGTLNKIGGNSCTGSSDIMVCEACEYVDSFLELYPRISVILNVDKDHLDYFKTFDRIKESFNKFAKQTRDLLIVNGDDSGTQEVIKKLGIRTISYGISPTCDYHAENLELNSMKNYEFNMITKGENLVHISLGVPGKHNVYNAMAAAIAARQFEIPAQTIAKSLSEFKGAHRRFEILKNIDGITVADDFAHHPTEIRATLTTAKNMGFNRVILVFQPHTFSRTAMFLDEFAQTLSIADKVFVTDILPVREINTYNIHPEDLTSKMQNAVYTKTFEQAANCACEVAKPGDLILTMGGGNVYQCAHMILDKLTPGDKL